MVEIWPYERCSTKVLLLGDGSTAFQFGYEAAVDCPNSHSPSEVSMRQKRSQTIDITVCWDCCADNLCNRKLCGVPDSNTTDLACLSGNNVVLWPQNISISYCDGDELCVARGNFHHHQERPNQQPSFSYGCASKVVCDHLSRKLSDPESSELCQKCCSEDGCNAHICHSPAHNQLETTTSVTDIEPSATVSTTSATDIEPSATVSTTSATETSATASTTSTTGIGPSATVATTSTTDIEPSRTVSTTSVTDIEPRATVSTTSATDIESSAIVSTSATYIEPSATVSTTSVTDIEPSVTASTTSATDIEPSATVSTTSATEPSATASTTSTTGIEPSTTVATTSTTDIEPSTTVSTTSASGTTHIGPFYTDCWDLLNRGGFHQDGVYEIYPDPTRTRLHVRCDMTTDGGGWIVLQRRYDGSLNFTRTSEEYEEGFGNVAAEHWLGLQWMHILTSQNTRPVQLRVDLCAFRGDAGYAKYNVFTIAGRNDTYRLNVGGYAGGSLRDYLSTHSGVVFDARGQGFIMFKGGWWYIRDTGFYVNLNGGVYHGGSLHGIVWLRFAGASYTSLRSSEMKIRPANVAGNPLRPYTCLP